jgi:hypothetical protein
MDSERKGMFEDAIKLYDLAGVSIFFLQVWWYNEIVYCASEENCVRSLLYTRILVNLIHC